MNNKDFKAKNLVFDNYVIVDDNGNIDFKLELKSAIDKNYISRVDAFNIIYELMYGVINYNHGKNKVKEELFELIKKVKEYNLKDETTIKNSVLFFKDYSHEKNLIIVFNDGLNVKKEGIVKNDSSKIDNSNSINNSNYSSNNGKLSVRERVELDKEIRRITSVIRKDHPYDWREILRTTPVYKKRHNIVDSETQNYETKDVSKSTNKNKNKNELEDIKLNDSNKEVMHKENVEINDKDNLRADSAINKNKVIDNIINKLRKNSDLINDFFSEINNNGFLSFEKKEEIISKYSQIYKIASKINEFSDSYKQKIFLEFDNLKRFFFFF